MLATLRAMPWSVRIFLGYAFLLLAFLGLTLRLVVDLAIEAPVSGPGLLWMLLLAYLIFTITLALQRKQAAWGLSLGLASLTVPLVPLLLLSAGIPGLLVALALAGVVFGALTRRSARQWFVEP
jgi:hypothetical protein